MDCGVVLLICQDEIGFFGNRIGHGLFVEGPKEEGFLPGYPAGGGVNKSLVGDLIACGAYSRLIHSDIFLWIRLYLP